MPKTMNDVVKEQLGGLIFELMSRDLQLELANEKIKELEAELAILRANANGAIKPPTPLRPVPGQKEAT